MTATAEKAKVQGLPEGAAVFGKTALEKVVVELTEYRGHQLVNSRIWFLDDSDEWRPTKKGLALDPELAEEVAGAMLQKARVKGEGRGNVGRA